MRIRTFLFALAALLLAPAAHAQSSEADLQQLYLSFLQGEGIEGWVDSDGDVQFEYNDRTYFMETNASDTEFFRVVLWDIWPIESATESIQVINALNEVNREMKVVKGYVTNDNVWLACELFVGEPSAFAPVWSRCMDSIESGLDVFVGEM